MQLEGRRVVVVGLGRSGIAAARLCRRMGARVVATDAKPLELLDRGIRELDCELRLGGHNGVDFGSADLVVMSPGVPAMAAVESAAARGTEVISELELGWRFAKAPVICVGGTNGKSTVTTLTAGMLTHAGLRTFCGGNLGVPLCEVVTQPFDVLVLEASSFQLERVPTFRPRVAVLLNISDDHLDRYPDAKAYADAKGNAFRHQESSDVAIIPALDEACEAQARRGKAKIVSFGTDGDYRVEGLVVVERASGRRFDLDGTSLHGAHNVMNAAAAIAAVVPFGVETKALTDALRSFEPLQHRMAFVRDVAGVRFYDDSKATNVGAAVTALRGLSEPLGVLIAGGRDKLGSYASLADALEAKGRGLVLIGEASEAIAEAVGERVPVRFAQDMMGAVAAAFDMAHAGDAVLLSPACASFDMFRSYADRGEQFVMAVQAIATRGPEEARR